MDYLARDTATFDEAFWQKIDDVVVNTAARQMIGRRLLPLNGPLGPGAEIVSVDSQKREEEIKEGYIATVGRKYLPVTQIYADFWLYWRDIAKTGEANPDLSAAARAASEIAHKEDMFIFNGIEEMGIEGLLNAKGIQTMDIGDWGSGENAFHDIAEAMTRVEEAGCVGRYALAVSPDLYLALSRLQANTGLLEVDRIGQMLGTKIRKSTALKPNTAVFLCNEPHFVDLCVGMDVGTSYVEYAELNHHFRIFETMALRVKMPEAIVAFK